MVLQLGNTNLFSIRFLLNHEFSHVENPPFSELSILTRSLKKVFKFKRNPDLWKTRRDRSSPCEF